MPIQESNECNTMRTPMRHPSGGEKKNVTLCKTRLAKYLHPLVDFVETIGALVIRGMGLCGAICGARALGSVLPCQDLGLLLPQLHQFDIRCHDCLQGRVIAAHDFLQKSICSVD